MTNKYSKVENLSIKYNQIDVNTYLSLYKSTGWSKISREQIHNALQNSIFSVLVSVEDNPVAMGRIIGDGFIYCYIQDVIVLPQFQKLGIGKIIIHHLLQHLEDSSKDRLFIGLMAAKGTIEFYKKLGFVERPQLGPGMFRILN